MKKTFADFEVRANPTSGDFILVSPVNAVGEIKVASLGSIVDAMIGEHWRGEWSDQEPYYKYDVVSYGGSLYIAEMVNIGKIPSSNPEWSIWVSKGDTGAKGEDGQDGLPGGLSDTVQFSHTTAVVAPNEVLTFEMVLPRLFVVHRIVASLPIRLRLYLNSEYRTNDLNRVPTTMLRGNHGAYFDIQVKTETSLIRNLFPPAMCASSGQGFLSLTNMSDTQDIVNILLFVVPLESNYGN